MEKIGIFFLKLWIYDELAVDFVERHFLPQGFQSIICESIKADSHCESIIFAVKTQWNFIMFIGEQWLEKKDKNETNHSFFYSLVRPYLKQTVESWHQIPSAILSQRPQGQWSHERCSEDLQRLDLSARAAQQSTTTTWVAETTEVYCLPQSWMLHTWNQGVVRAGEPSVPLSLLVHGISCTFPAPPSLGMALCPTCPFYKDISSIGVVSTLTWLLP